LNKIKELLRDHLLLTIITSLLIGLSLGLVYGYIINPVEWVDAPLDIVRQDLQEDYLRMAIDSYQVHKNDLLAITRWQELGASASGIFKEIKYSPEEQGWEAVFDFEKVVTIRDARPISIECETLAVEDNSLNLILWGGTTLLVIGFGSYFFIQSRQSKSSPASGSGTALRRWEAVAQPHLGKIDNTSKDQRIDFQLVKELDRYRKNPPLANHIWTFVMGDDLYEETCSIDSKKGHFLGECGIEIARTMENSTPKRPTAFDVWLFDKNEINTRSAILMSHNAFDNDLLRIQFEVKGKPILAEIGKEIEIGTDHLTMRIRVLDMICAQNEPGRCEYFQRLSLDVSIWEI